MQKVAVTEEGLVNVKRAEGHLQRCCGAECGTAPYGMGRDDLFSAL